MSDLNAYTLEKGFLVACEWKEVFFVKKLKLVNKKKIWNENKEKLLLTLFSKKHPKILMKKFSIYSFFLL